MVISIDIITRTAIALYIGIYISLMILIFLVSISRNTASFIERVKRYSVT